METRSIEDRAAIVPDGEMADRLRDFGWAATPLGERSCWPERVAGAVETMLATPQLASLTVGPARIFLYNDHAARAYGGRHPTVLGLPLAEAFPHEVDRVAGYYDRAFAGESLHVPAQPLDPSRSGHVELFDAYLTPIRDHRGAVLAVLMTGNAVGDHRGAEERRRREARQALLLRLSDALRSIDDPVAIRRTAMELLGEELGLARLFYFAVEADDDGSPVQVVEHGYRRDPVQAAFVGRHASSAFGDGFDRGDPVVVSDIETLVDLTDEQRAAYRALGVAAFVSVPLRRGGADAGGIGAHDTAPRAWHDSEIDLIREVAERAAMATERARTQSALRASEEDYRSLFESMAQGYVENELVRDPDGRAIDYRLIAANPQYERLVGVPVAEAVGRLAQEIVPGLERWWVDTFARIVASGEAEHFEHEASAIDRWYAIDAFPRGGDRFALLYDDITDRRRVETALRDTQERQSFLLALADALRPLDNTADMAETATRLLGERLAASRACLVEWPPGQDHCDVARGYAGPGNPEIVGRYPIEPLGSTRDRIAAGRTWVVEDAGADTGLAMPERARYLAHGAAAWVSVPLSKRGGTDVTLWVIQAVPRRWTPAEIASIEETAERLLMAVERAGAETALRESERNFQSLFSASPVPFMVLSPDPPDFIVTAANDAYLAATLTTRERLIGSRLFDIFTDDITRPDADGPAELKRSLQRVLTTRKPDAMPRQRYDIARPDGSFESRWWLAINAPVFDAAGEVSKIIHQVSNVTGLHRAEVAEQDFQARQAFLLKLSDALRPLADPMEIENQAANLIGHHFTVANANYAQVETVAGVECFIVRNGYVAPGSRSFVGRYPVAEFPGVGEELFAGRTLVVDEVDGDPRLGAADRASCRAIGIAAFIVVPLLKHDRLVAQLNVYEPGPRRWTPNEIHLLEEIAERTWDAVERARAEAALRESRERLALAFRTVPVGIALIDRTGETLIANDEMRRFLPTGIIPSHDVTRSERWLAWDTPGNRVPPHDYPGARALRGETIVPGMQMRYRDDDGHEIWTEILASPLHDDAGGITGAITVVVDVDRLKRSEEAAQASEERLRQFGEASQDNLWIRDATTMQWLYLTPSFETIYGISRAQALAGDNYRNWQQLVLPVDRDYVLASIARVCAGEAVTYEFRVRRPSDGAVRWIRDTDFPIFDGAGKVTLIGGIGHDFTEGREAELRLQTLVDGIPQLVWRAVGQGNWTWASPQWTQFTGQAEAAYRGWRWIDALHLDDHDRARKAWSQAVDNGGFEVECRIRRQGDGEYRWFQTRAVAVRDHAGSIIEWLGTSTDIHDLRQMQESQRVLVSELQHRTRNLMGVIRSMADKTARAGGDLTDFRTRFRARLEALSRVQGLLSRMNDHDRVTFDELVATELAAMDGTADRVTVDGPSGVRLRSSTVQTLAMALHELATNAMKYGALGQPAGRLSITWRLDRPAGEDCPWLHIDWRESGVAMPFADAAPRGTGQGRELIERALPYQLQARTSYLLGPDGVRCTIAVPVSASTT